MHVCDLIKSGFHDTKITRASLPSRLTPSLVVTGWWVNDQSPSKCKQTQCTHCNFNLSDMGVRYSNMSCKIISGHEMCEDCAVQSPLCSDLCSTKICCDLRGLGSCKSILQRIGVDNANGHCAASWQHSQRKVMLQTPAECRALQVPWSNFAKFAHTCMGMGVEQGRFNDSIRWQGFTLPPVQSVTKHKSCNSTQHRGSVLPE